MASGHCNGREKLYFRAINAVATIPLRPADPVGMEAVAADFAVLGVSGDCVFDVDGAFRIMFDLTLMLAAILTTSPPTLPSGSGILVGCFFPNGPKQVKGDLRAVGAFLDSKSKSQIVVPESVRDPHNLLGPARFKSVKISASSIQFSGLNSMILRRKGGELYDASLVRDGQSVTMRGTCQIGPARDRESALKFFDGLVGKMVRPVNIH